MRHAWIAAALACIATPSRPQDAIPPAPGPPTAFTPDVAGESHAWAAVPGASPGTVVHFPPRSSGSGTTPVRDAHAVVALRLGGAPEAMAAWERDLVLIMPPETSAAETNRPPPRDVLLLRTEPDSLSGRWIYDAADKLHVLPSLREPGGIASSVGTPLGPVVVLADPPRLLYLDSTRWVDATPWSGRPTDVSLVAGPNGLWVGVREGSPAQPRAWFSPWEGGPRARASGFAFGEVAPAPDLIQSGRVLVALAGDSSPDGPARFVHVARAAGVAAAEIRASTPAGSALLWRGESIPSRAAAVHAAESRRVIFMWAVPPERGAGRPTERIVEVSTTTGRTLFDGEVDAEPPVSLGEFRTLVALMVAITAGVLAFALRVPGGPIPIPEGHALAEPGQRLVAALIDALPGALIACVIWDVPFGWLISPWLFLSNPDSLAWLGTTLAIATVLCTIAEAMSGRSPGKHLAGLRVVAIRRHAGVASAHTPGLWRAFARNSIRWGVLPLTVMGVLMPDRRHLGDRCAKCVVLTRVAAG